MFRTKIKITQVVARFAKWPLATLMLTTALLCQGVQARNWIDGNIGNWEDGSNWEYGTPPSAGDDVYIDDGHATLSSDAGTIEYLSIADYYPTDQATLTLDGPDAALAVSLITSLGHFGDATLEVLNGALFSSPYYFGFFAGGPGGGAGNILLGGSVGSRGTLEASRIVREADSGGGFLTFDGGVLRAASTASGDILSGWSEDVTLNAGGAFIDSNGRDIILRARLVGTGALTKWGQGNLTLEGNNTYSGGTVVEEGTLVVNHSQAAGVGTISIDSGAVLRYGDGVDISNQISGTGYLEVAAGNTATQSAWVNPMSSDGIIKTGAGTLILTRDESPLINPYGYGIEEGTLQIGAGGTTGNLTTDGGVINDARLVFNRSNSLTVANWISGSGSVTQAGTGTLVLVGTNSYSGGTVIEAGTLAVNRDARLGAVDTSVTLAGGTLATLRSFTSSNRTMAFAAGTTSAIDVGIGDTLTWAGDFTGSTGDWHKTGAGTLTLTNNNASLSGAVTIDAGVLQIGAGGPSGGLGSGEVTNNANLVFNRSDELTVNNAITGGGSVHQVGSGTVILANDNASFAGAVTIDAGTLQVGAGGTSGGLGSGAVTNNANLAFNRSNNFTVNNVITGSGSVMHTGSGTTTLTGTNTYSGDTTVSGGTLVVNGSITSAVTVEAGGTLSGSGSVGAVTSTGTLAPGNTPETLTVAGDLVLDSMSVLDFELDTPGVVGGGVNDLIEVNGNLTLDGTLNIIDWGNYGAGTYRLINYTGTLTDNGSTIGTQPAGFNAVLDTSTPGEVNLIVSATATAGSIHPLPIFNLPGLLFMALLLAVSGLVRLRRHRWV